MLLLSRIFSSLSVCLFKVVLSKQRGHFVLEITTCFQRARSPSTSEVHICAAELLATSEIVSVWQKNYLAKT